jgi:serine protease Do/serine protease DegQ
MENMLATNNRRRIARQRFLFLVCGFVFAASPHAGAAIPQFVGDEEMPSLAPMLERATPAVVNIAAVGSVRLRSHPLLNDPFFRRFFRIPDQPRERKTQSLGSGVIVDAQRGLVLTNSHVIANATQITVKLRDGRTLTAERVGADPETDIAVIKIPAEGLTALPIADAHKLRVGDFVVAIGNPFGLGQTVTSGIISALARSALGITGYDDLIQTDASINPGNSGGALVNLRGELVGINTAIFSQSGGSIGIGFAIPVDMAEQVMEQLLEYGEVRRGFVGAQLQDLDPDLADAFGIKSRRGAVLVNILPQSPAAKAGLEPGDVVVSANGEPVMNAADFRNEVGLTPIGQSVDLEFIRGGKKRRARIVVAGREEVTAAVADKIRNERLAGATFGDIPEESPAYGRIGGVMVFELKRDSYAVRAGLREGDIITSVNRTRVPNLKAFLQLVGRSKGQLLFRVLRGNSALFIVIK